MLTISGELVGHTCAVLLCPVCQCCSLVRNMLLLEYNHSLLALNILLRISGFCGPATQFSSCLPVVCTTAHSSSFLSCTSARR